MSRKGILLCIADHFIIWMCRCSICIVICCPGQDDGAGDFRTSLAMARAFADQGVVCVACTPHIMPGVYPNCGPQIRRAVTLMQQRLNEAGIRLKVVPGADNHIVPDFVAGLKEGRLLTLADSTYVLVEPPHHVAPARLEDLFFDICLAGYVPVLTHPKDYPGSRVNMMSSKDSLAGVSGCKSRPVPYVAGSGGAHAIGLSAC